MPVFEQETRDPDVTEPEAILRARSILEALPDQTAIEGARNEGMEICSILRPLGLPPVLNAAVQLYPAVREGQLDSKALQKAAIPELDNLVGGLVQLGGFAETPCEFELVRRGRGLAALVMKARL